MTWSDGLLITGAVVAVVGAFGLSVWFGLIALGVGVTLAGFFLGRFEDGTTYQRDNETQS